MVSQLKHDLVNAVETAYENCERELIKIQKQGMNRNTANRLKRQARQHRNREVKQAVLDILDLDVVELEEAARWRVKNSFTASRM